MTLCQLKNVYWIFSYEISSNQTTAFTSRWKHNLNWSDSKMLAWNLRVCESQTKIFVGCELTLEQFVSFYLCMNQSEL